MEYIKEIGPGFYNIRGSFKLFLGMLDLGSHMSLAKLKSGKFVVIDTIDLSPEQKKEFDELTDNGTLIESVLATHPFHTLHFPKFYKAYPNPKYYGTPRHLKIQPEIPWAGSLNCKETRDMYSPEIEMRIPAGSEFVDPQPPRSNHFSNVFVFHRASRTVFNDDTMMVANNPGFVLSKLGLVEGKLNFHPSISGPGLYPTKEAPYQFKKFCEEMIADWDFVNLCSAHNGNAIGNAKELLISALDAFEPKFKEISERNACGKGHEQTGAWSDDEKDGDACG